MSFESDEFRLTGSQIVDICAFVCAYSYAREVGTRFHENPSKFAEMSDDWLAANRDNQHFAASVRNILGEVMSGRIKPLL